MDGNGLLGSLDSKPYRFTHLLQTEGENQKEEIVRGGTTWRKKISTMPFSI
ncbi:hypothetical protein SLEP1_g54202 [Rubroshorea leprosula]|uniref:Uncharacterized protein n=1 Tax=Rubroshorea leprosula TaxID=152421 RepID=A0AAV5ME51_9ROSI|nr:hypothetical protein SLEP1_g54202 [Rubroshorea leprosula]